MAQKSPQCYSSSSRGIKSAVLQWKTEGHWWFKHLDSMNLHFEVKRYQHRTYYKKDHCIPGTSSRNRKRNSSQYMHKSKISKPWGNRQTRFHPNVTMDMNRKRGIQTICLVMTLFHNLEDLINKFSKIVGSKINIQNLISYT